MSRYIIRRLLLLIPVLFFVSLAIFMFVRLLPGDVVEARLAIGASAGGGWASPKEIQAMRHEMGLDQPAAKQYFIWLGHVVRGDLGDSLFYKTSVAAELMHAIPISLELALLALIVSVSIAIPLGTLSAMRQDTWVDYVSRLISVGGLSVPDFVVGTALVVLPSIWFHWTPPLGYRSFFDSPSANLQQFILPAAALGLRFSATTMRMTRSSMLEVLRADYVRTAWSKGLNERVVIVRHALKNAMIAPITLIGGQIGFLIGGTVVIETIFSLPGVGRLALASIQQRDYTQLQGTVLFLATVFVVVNLLVDLSYAWLDPRIRYQ